MANTINAPIHDDRGFTIPTGVYVIHQTKEPVNVKTIEKNKYVELVWLYYASKDAYNSGCRPITPVSTLYGTIPLTTNYTVANINSAGEGLMKCQSEVTAELKRIHGVETGIITED